MKLMTRPPSFPLLWIATKLFSRAPMAIIYFRIGFSPLFFVDICFASSFSAGHALCCFSVQIALGVFVLFPHSCFPMAISWLRIRGLAILPSWCPYSPTEQVWAPLFAFSICVGGYGIVAELVRSSKSNNKFWLANLTPLECIHLKKQFKRLNSTTCHEVLNKKEWLTNLLNKVNRHNFNKLEFVYKWITEMIDKVNWNKSRRFSGWEELIKTSNKIYWKKCSSGKTET